MAVILEALTFVYVLGFVFVYCTIILMDWDFWADWFLNIYNSITLGVMSLWEEFGLTFWIRLDWKGSRRMIELLSEYSGQVEEK